MKNIQTRIIVVLLCISSLIACDNGVGKYITQLGDSNFDKREEATKILAEKGYGILAELVAAARDGKPEVRQRATSIVLRIFESLSTSKKKEDKERLIKASKKYPKLYCEYLKSVFLKIDEPEKKRLAAFTEFYNKYRADALVLLKENRLINLRIVHLLETKDFADADSLIFLKTLLDTKFGDEMRFASEAFLKSDSIKNFEHLLAALNNEFFETDNEKEYMLSSIEKHINEIYETLPRSIEKQKGRLTLIFNALKKLKKRSVDDEDLEDRLDNLIEKVNFLLDQ